MIQPVKSLKPCDGECDAMDYYHPLGCLGIAFIKPRDKKEIYGDPQFLPPKQHTEVQ